MCGTGQRALPLSPFVRKESSRHQKKKFSLLEISGVMFFVGEKEETWRTKKEPSKEKIRMVKNQMCGVL